MCEQKFSISFNYSYKIVWFTYRFTVEKKQPINILGQDNHRAIVDQIHVGLSRILALSEGNLSLGKKTTKIFFF